MEILNQGNVLHEFFKEMSKMSAMDKFNSPY